MPKPLAESRIQIEPLRCAKWRAERGGICIPTCGMADAFEASVPGGLKLLKHGFRGIAQHQISMTDYTRARAVFAVQSAGTLRRDAVHIFDLTNRFEGILSHDLADVRQALQLPAGIPVVDCDAREWASVKETLLVLFDLIVTRINIAHPEVV